MPAEELSRAIVSVERNAGGSSASIEFAAEESGELFQEWWSAAGQQAFHRWVQVETGEVQQDRFGT